MKRFYCETNGYNMVAYVDENGKAFIVHDCNECDISTLDKAKTALADSPLNECTDVMDCLTTLGINYDITDSGIVTVTSPYDTHYTVVEWSNIETQAYAEHDRTEITEF